MSLKHAERLQAQHHYKITQYEEYPFYDPKAKGRKPRLFLLIIIIISSISLLLLLLLAWL